MGQCVAVELPTWEADTPGSQERAPVPAQSVLPEAIVSQGRVTRRAGSPPVITSQALDWPGVLLEVGKNDVSAADDVLLNQHFISLNIDSRPLTLEVKEPYGFKQFTMPPQSIWVSAAAEPLTLRVTSTLCYVRMSIDPVHLARLLGPSPVDVAPVQLRRMYAIRTPQIVHLMKSLVAEAAGRNPHGLAFVEAATAGLGHLLVSHAGIAQPRPERARGVLSPGVRRRTLEMIAARLDGRLTVDALAREVGLSPAHFARAFKETMGRAPHQYLLSQRLEHARRLLELPGARLAEVAQRTGFADQAHFTRLFKRAFGLPPGALVRRRG
ncbi:MAG TPA: AraC family transcriptional regulator [Gemmatimonadales bacterium]|nr:AraC family transcriptional regulator [Gemmatimonadales bacterium]